MCCQLNRNNWYSLYKVITLHFQFLHALFLLNYFVCTITQHDAFPSAKKLREDYPYSCKSYPTQLVIAGRCKAEGMMYLRIWTFTREKKIEWTNTFKDRPSKIRGKKKFTSNKINCCQLLNCLIHKSNINCSFIPLYSKVCNSSCC